MRGISSAIMLFVAFAIWDLRAQPVLVEWPALEDFHTVIAAVNYPAEKGNLVPLRKRSKELVTKAVLLNNSKIPGKLGGEEMRRILKVILAETRVLNKLVKKNNGDRHLIQKLNTVHEHFNQLLELYKKEDY